jgi:hypothetical protein
LVGKPVNSASSTRKSFHAHKQCGTGCVLAGQVASGGKGPPPSRLLTCMLRVRSQAARLSEMATAPVGKYLVERVRPATTSRTAVVSCLCKHREKPRFVRQLPSSFVRFPPPTSTSTRVLNRRLARASLPTVTSLAVLPCAPWAGWHARTARSIVCCSEEPRRPFRRFFRRVLLRGAETSVPEVLSSCALVERMARTYAAYGHGCVAIERPATRTRQHGIGAAGGM